MMGKEKDRIRQLFEERIALEYREASRVYPDNEAVCAHHCAAGSLEDLLTKLEEEGLL